MEYLVDVMIVLFTMAALGYLGYLYFEYIEYRKFDREWCLVLLYEMFILTGITFLIKGENIIFGLFLLVPSIGLLYSKAFHDIPKAVRIQKMIDEGRPIYASCGIELIPDEHGRLVPGDYAPFSQR